MMRSKGTVVILAVVGVLAALLGLNYLRSTPTTSAADLPRTSTLADMPPLPANSNANMMAANQPITPIDNASQNTPPPIAVRCGDTVVTVHAADPRAVSVDCSQVGRSLQPVATQTALRDEEVVAQPVVHRTVRRRAVRSQPVYYYDDVREQPRYHKKRSWQKEALIIGGSAGAGTAIGAIAGGGKGAAIGAATGGVAGLVYDLATRNK